MLELMDEPGVAAMRDLQDSRLVARAELLNKGVCICQEFAAQLAEEARRLGEMMEKQFPGYSTTASRMTINREAAVETNAAKGFPL